MSLWIAMTAEGKNQHRGSNMTMVDEALRAYWEAHDSLKPPEEVGRALVLVLKTCNKWLKTKAGKQEVVIAAFSRRRTNCLPSGRLP